MDHIEHINPDELMKSPAFSQVAVTKGNGSTIWIGGQNAVNKDLEVVGKGDLKAQTEFIMKNIGFAVEAAGGTIDDIFKLTIYIVQGQDVRKGFEGAADFLKQIKNPPVISGVLVAGLTNPDYLVEIEAVAFKKD